MCAFLIFGIGDDVLRFLLLSTVLFGCFGTAFCMEGAQTVYDGSSDLIDKRAFELRTKLSLRRADIPHWKSAVIYFTEGVPFLGTGRQIIEITSALSTIVDKFIRLSSEAPEGSDEINQKFLDELQLLRNPETVFYKNKYVRSKIPKFLAELPVEQHMKFLGMVRIVFEDTNFLHSFVDEKIQCLFEIHKKDLLTSEIAMAVNHWFANASVLFYEQLRSRLVDSFVGRIALKTQATFPQTVVRASPYFGTVSVERRVEIANFFHRHDEQVFMDLLNLAAPIVNDFSDFTDDRGSLFIEILSELETLPDPNFAVQEIAKHLDFLNHENRMHILYYWPKKNGLSATYVSDIVEAKKRLGHLSGNSLVSMCRAYGEQQEFWELLNVVATVVHLLPNCDASYIVNKLQDKSTDERAQIVSILEQYAPKIALDAVCLNLLYCFDSLHKDQWGEFAQQCAEKFGKMTEIHDDIISCSRRAPNSFCRRDMDELLSQFRKIKTKQ